MAVLTLTPGIGASTTIFTGVNAILLRPWPDPPTRTEVQALKDGLVAAVTLLNEIRGAPIEKGVVKGGM